MTLPISGSIGLNDIRVELGIPTQSPITLELASQGNYVPINQNSTYKPNSVSPYTFSSWWGYNHTEGPQSQIYVGGQFTIYQGSIARNFIARLNTDGSNDSSFNIGTGFNNNVNSSSIQSDGKAVVGGNFTTYQGISRIRIARLNTDGSYDTSFNIGNGFDGNVNALTIQSDGKVVAVGAFTTYQGIRNIGTLNTDGTYDTSFNIGIGIGSDVNALSVQSDGKIVVGGAFTSYQGTIARNYIVRLNTDGSNDASFNIGTGFSSTVNSLSIQSDGKIVVGGGFTTYQGISRIRIARLNTDGSNDASFNIGTGFNSNVLSLAIQSDGKILAGGMFTTYQGVTRNFIIRLNTDGTYDTSFNIGTGFNNTVTSIIIQSDGKIVVGGSFSTYQGVTINRIARLNTDGSYDTSFNIGTGFNNPILSLFIQSDGKVVVGGQFTTYQGINRNYIARLNTDGSYDSSFNIGTGFNVGVNSLSIQSDGKVVAAGAFTSYNPPPRNQIIRLNTDGSYDSSFNIGTGFDISVLSSSIQSDGKIVVGGNFTTYQGITRNRIARLNTDGSYDTSFNIGTGFGSTVNALSIQSDGKVVVGGAFQAYQSVSRNYIVRLNTDGLYDSSFNIGTGFNSVVNALSIQSDGKVVVGGLFTSYQGITRNRIARLNTDGSNDASFNIGTGFNNNVNALSIQSDGKIVVGGSFTLYNPPPRNYIVRLNTDGTYDTSFNIGTGFNNTVTSIIIQSDGKIVVGGSFSTYQGVTINRIVRLNTDDSIDTSFNIGTGFNNAVTLLSIQSDGKIVVGGSFTTYQGISRNYIARLNTDGSYDTSFNIGTGFNNIVNALSIQSDGKIVVGGGFTTYQGTPRNRIARLNTDGSYDSSFNIGTGFDSTVNALSIQSDGKIVVGGAFTTYQGITRNRIARLNTDGSYDSSFNIGTGFNNTVNSIIIQSDGKVVVGGSLSTYQGVSRNFIVRLNTDGSYDTSFNIETGFNNAVNTLSIQSDGKIVVGGQFSTYQGMSRTRITRLNSNGSIDPSFNIGNGFNSTAFSLAIQSNGKILVGGQFTLYNPPPRNNIARLNTDGSYDSSFNIGTGFNSTVNALSIQSDGKIVVGGSFTIYQETIAKTQIIRLNTDGSDDSSFNIGNGFNSNVNSLSIQSDGKIVVGGAFTTYQGISRNRIARLNTDGSYDTSFNIGTGFNNNVNALSIQSDGKVVAFGIFTSYNPPPRNRIIRLNTDGSDDTSFNIGTGFNDFVNCLIIKSDGKIVIGGRFGAYNSPVNRFITRLNTDGSNDYSFNIGTGFSNTVNSLLVQSDGKIVVGGLFITYQGVTRNRIARLNTDGSYDSSFNIGTGFNSIVNALSIQSDGKVVVGGAFTSYQGITRSNIFISNSDGSDDTSFNTGTGFNSNVSSSSIQSDGKVVVGGQFTTYQGITRNRIARLNTDGSYDTSFNIGTGFNNTVTSIIIQSDGKIVVGGQFTTYQGINRNYIARLNTDGSYDSSFNIGTGFNVGVNSLSIQSDGKIVVGGGFTTYQDTPRNRIARLNTDGSYDSSFNIGTGFNSNVLSLAIQSDGKIVAGGMFITYQGVTRNRIARLNTDGSYDTSFNIGTGFGSTVNALSIQSDGKVVVGGAFQTYQGVSRNYIARLNTDGLYDTSFNIGTGFNNSVNALSIQSDAKIVFGGVFNTYQGVTRNRIARLNTDGSYDTSFIIGNGVDGSISTLSIWSDGKIVAGGSTTSYNQPQRNRIIRLNTDGSDDTSFNTGTGFNNSVNALSIQSDGKIVVGGSFTTYQDVSRNFIVRLNTDGSYDTSFNIGTGFGSTVRSIIIQSDGKVVVGGAFTSYQGISRNYIARLNTDGSYDTSFNIGNGFNSDVLSIKIS